MIIKRKDEDFSVKRNFQFPAPICFGAGVVRTDLANYLLDQNLKRPLIVSDSFLCSLDFFKVVIKNLKKKNLEPILFSKFHKNPIKEDVHQGGYAFRENKCDAIIGLGGGASLDVARAICVKAYHDEDLFHYEDGIGDHLITGPIPHFVAIPTTSGTGSEVGRSAIISDDKTKEKKIIFSPKLMAKQVFCDPELTFGLPAHITAATGMDALTHNLEAYYVDEFHPMCDGIALKGIQLIHESLRPATKEGSNLIARSKMMMSSLMGAVAFQKGLGVVHSLAHPMSTLFDTHHGVANAMMLSYGVKFNSRFVKEKEKVVARIFGCENLEQYLNDLREELEVPAKLKDIGITKNALEDLADLAIKDFCHPTNPRPVTRDDFLALYQESYE